ncbi:MAG TPA: hypothetical protein VGG19_11610 [Tepidisphaeraceae bacterium]|jgi:hypothetical protein
MRSEASNSGLNRAVTSGRAINRRLRDTAIVSLWTSLFLVLFDFAINHVYQVPKNRLAEPTPSQIFFNAGNSLKTTLRTMVGPDKHSDRLIAPAGWVPRPSDVATAQRSTSQASLSISFYGMSFTDHIANIIRTLDHSIIVNSYGGPAAPPNRTYADYLARYQTDHSDVVVFGILSSSVPAMGTLAAFTRWVDWPPECTYPRYILNDRHQLAAINPIISNLDGLRNALWRKPELWNAMLDQLSKYDCYYDPMRIDYSALDRSSLLRLARHALVQRHVQAINAKFENEAGFINRPDLGPVLSEIVRQFAQRANQRHQLPIVLLFQDQPYRDHLDRLMIPALQKSDICFITTSQIAPGNDPANFVADGHFNHESDIRIAKTLLLTIKSRVDAAKFLKHSTIASNPSSADHRDYSQDND